MHVTHMTPLHMLLVIVFSMLVRKFAETGGRGKGEGGRREFPQWTRSKGDPESTRVV
jgi:hypothetical protein